jgi:hypothetical protein
MEKLAITSADEAQPGRLKRMFNWLAAPPARNFTLGELWAHAVHGRAYDDYRNNPLRFSTAGRISERLHTGLGVLTAAVVVAAAPTLPGAIAAAVLVTGLCKIWGIAGGKIADRAVRGSYFPKFGQEKVGIRDKSAPG